MVSGPPILKVAGLKGLPVCGYGESEEQVRKIFSAFKRNLLPTSPACQWTASTGDHKSTFEQLTNWQVLAGST